MRVYVIAGESSGDQLGALLLQAIQEKTEQNPWQFIGIGGPLMRQKGLRCTLPMEELSVMGLTDVLLALPQLVKYFFSTKKEILQLRPDAVLFIDYPGWNLRMASSLRKSGFKGKIIQYVSPTIWAHGKERIHTIASSTDLLLTIFPFEKDYYATTPLAVEYVGHPLVDMVDAYQENSDWTKQVGLRTTEGLLGIFPGSRKSEIQHNFRNQLMTAAKFQEMHPGTPVAISLAREDLRPLIEAKIRRTQHLFTTPPVIVPPKFRHELMSASHAAIAVSGTVTLELALHKTPTLVLYHVTTFNRLFARFFLKLTMTRYCIVNIISKKDLFPELILHPFKLPTAYTYLESLYSEQTVRNNCKLGCEQLRSLLDGKGSLSSSAKHIIELVQP